MQSRRPATADVPDLVGKLQRSAGGTRSATGKRLNTADAASEPSVSGTKVAPVNASTSGEVQGRSVAAPHGGSVIRVSCHTAPSGGPSASGASDATSRGTHVTA